jgi:hypothetical protein
MLACVVAGWKASCAGSCFKSACAPCKCDACERRWPVLRRVPVVDRDHQLLPAFQVQAEVVEALQNQQYQ